MADQPQAIAEVVYSGQEPRNSLKWVDPAGVDALAAGTKLYAAPTQAEELAAVLHWRGKHADAIRELEQLKVENEGLRQRPSNLSTFNMPVQDYRLSGKCLVCGESHPGLAGLPCPNMKITAQTIVEA